MSEHDLKNDMKKILGYGEKITVLVDKDDGQVEMEFHFRPVPIKHLQESQRLVKRFIELTDNSNDDSNIVWNAETIEIAVELTFLCLKRTHKDITKTFIEDNFTLGTLGASVRIILDINGFLEQMTMISEKMNQTLQQKKMAVTTV